MPKESNGERRQFRPITLSTVLVALLALGTFVVWYVLLTRPAGTSIPAAMPSFSASPTTSAAPSATATPTPPPDPTAGWTRYSDSTDQFSVRYPSMWLQRTCTVDGHISLYLAPAPAALGTCNSGSGGQMHLIGFSGDQRSSHQLGTGYVDLATRQVTVAGVDGQRQSATVGVSAELSQPIGTKVVQYLFVTHGRTYLAYYGQAPGGATSTDVLTDFDLMVAGTLTFTS